VKRRGNKSLKLDEETTRCKENTDGEKEKEEGKERKIKEEEL